MWVTKWVCHPAGRVVHTSCIDWAVLFIVRTFCVVTLTLSGEGEIILLTYMHTRQSAFCLLHNMTHFTGHAKWIWIILISSHSCVLVKHVTQIHISVSSARRVSFISAVCVRDCTSDDAIGRTSVISPPRCCLSVRYELTKCTCGTSALFKYLSKYSSSQSNLFSTLNSLVSKPLCKSSCLTTSDLRDCSISWTNRKCTGVGSDGCSLQPKLCIPCNTLKACAARSPRGFHCVSSAGPLSSYVKQMCFPARAFRRLLKE